VAAAAVAPHESVPASRLSRVATGSPRISVCVPAYNEIAALPELYERLTATMDAIGSEWELVISDNRSTDGTRDYLRELAAKDPRVRVILLSRNFGHAAAHFAVLEHSSGEMAVLMDADLQDEPEAIPEMLEKAGEGYDVVYVLRAARPEGPLMKLATRGFYWLVNRISEVPQPANAGPFCLMSRRVVDHIVGLRERNVFFPGLRAFVGFSQVGIPLARPPRAGGRPRLRLSDRIRHGLDGILAFSNLPLRFAAWVGISVASMTAVLELVFVYFKLFTSKPFFGFTALITAILFLGGVQLFTIGVIGQYMGRVYDEVKGRPRYIVDEALNFDGPR
jgi:glycosyltransferase involved in cell wall biosynthesis